MNINEFHLELCKMEFSTAEIERAREEGTITKAEMELYFDKVEEFKKKYKETFGEDME